MWPEAIATIISALFQYLAAKKSKAMSYVPTPLPVGMTAFHAWSDDIIKLTGPLADVDSMKYVLASQVLALKPEQSRLPKAQFVNQLRNAAAKQIASAVFTDIRLKQQEAIKAAQTPSADTPLEQSADVKKD